jgi:carbamoyl-phosphate synthase large subunit
LYQIKDIVIKEQELAKFKDLVNVPDEFLWDLKKMGFSDEQIALALNCTEDEVYEYRKAKGVTRVFKQVDTCSAEFESPTPYLYSTFEKGSVNVNG